MNWHQNIFKELKIFLHLLQRCTVYQADNVL